MRALALIPIIIALAAAPAQAQAADGGRETAASPPEVIVSSRAGLRHPARGAEELPSEAQRADCMASPPKVIRFSRPLPWPTSACSDDERRSGAGAGSTTSP